ncbi:MAG: LysR family transcriptional regulator [Burkholderiales bacterium]
MTQRTQFDKIELSLIRVLHTLITESSVSRAALRLASTQPMVSAQLKRLRELTGDPLLVRCGNQMAPTAVALQLLEPAARMLQDAQNLFGERSAHQTFEPATSNAMFRIAASDFLDPFFLPTLVAQLKKEAPDVHLELVNLSGDFDYRRALASGDADLVVGNWLHPPEELHLGKLVSDEVVCLVSKDHPAVRLAQEGRFTVEKYLECSHVAPMPFHLGARGVVDDQLERLGLRRDISVRSAHFSLIPLMVARSTLVLTTGGLFCSRYLDNLAVVALPCPIEFPPMAYYQLWHDLTHATASMRWLRDQVRQVAQQLAPAAAGTSN